MTEQAAERIEINVDHDEGWKRFMQEGLRKGILDNLNKELLRDRDKYKLPLEYTDIIYLFVEFDKDAPKLIEAIRNARIDPDGADLLISKIITWRQVEQGF